ncbi:MAG: DUF4625 domain-containing protein [Bacteroidales bacterium]|nr:DUF4625 domain-containing protein [Bacteroidales bacterium]
MKKLYIIIITLSMLTFAACSKDDENEPDTEKPVIDLTMEGTTPQNGTVLHFGEEFTVKFRLTDNQELGSYSLNIHNNFDGHSHSTEEGEEEEHHHDEEEHHHHHDGDEEGDAFYMSEDYEIPAGKKEYIVNQTILLPETCEDGDEYAEGNYHFMISVTDQAGFSSFKAFEIKIEHHEHNHTK